MKIKIFAVCILTFTVSTVVINTLIIKKQVKEAISQLNSLSVNEEGALERGKEIEKEFRKRIAYISLTVSHDDLTEIEQSFAELIAYLEIGDTDGAYVTKNRLLDSLEHLGRLSGFNIDSII